MASSKEVSEAVFSYLGNWPPIFKDKGKAPKVPGYYQALSKLRKRFAQASSVMFDLFTGVLGNGCHGN